MPAKKRLRDIIIVLPGITGSVLESTEGPIWDVGIGAGWRALRSGGGSLEALMLKKPEATQDAIRATRLMKGPRVVPGLSKLDGYGTLTRAISARFEVVPGIA